MARTLTSALLAGACWMAMSATASAQTVVVEADRLFDGRAVIEDARLVIVDGVVTAVGPKAEVAAPDGATVTDLGDRFVMPGLIAAHSHVGMVNGVEQGGRFYTRETVASDLAQFQRYGVVAVNALGMNASVFHELRTEWRDGTHGGADLYGAGPGVGVVGGAPPQSMNPLPEQVGRPETPEQARALVDAQAAAGIDMVKVWVDDLNDSAPKMTPEVYQAAIAQAHVHGLTAAAHIHDLADAKGVVWAGVDVIGHGVRDMPVDEEFIALMLEHDVWYVPTVNINEAEYIYAEHPEWLDDPFFKMALDPALEARFRDEAWRTERLAASERPRTAVRTNIDNLRRLHAAGVKIALGTDSGATPLRIPGFAEHLELGHLVEAGMTPTEALRVATSNSAAMLGLTDRGCLTVGCRADLVVLTADPTTDIANSRTIKAVWRNGRPAD